MQNPCQDHYPQQGLCCTAAQALRHIADALQLQHYSYDQFILQTQPRNYSGSRWPDFLPAHGLHQLPKEPDSRYDFQGWQP